MAQKIHVVLVDDLDGSEGAETIRFGVDGQNYEIDLTDVNAKELRTTLDRYVAAGRKVKQRRQRRSKESV